MNSHILIVFSILLALNISVSSASQPSYQVSIYAHLHPRNPPIHLCNGAIIQSRLILTTASCVHYQFSIINPAIRIVPTMLSIIAGSSTPFSDELIVQVSDILLAKDFNYTTAENDLALLRLSDQLPLNKRNDMKWIILDDAEIYDGPSCLANFYVRNSLDGAQNYIQSEQLPLLNSEICRNRSEYPTEREADICSLYYLPTGFNCYSFETLQHYNEDRGTGLVCENNLVGTLSTVLPLLSKTNCVDKPLKAYYTSLAPHLEWIYDVVSQEDLKLFEEGNYISSSPYAGETFAFVQTEMETETDISIKPEPTKAATIDDSLKISSEPSFQMDQGDYYMASSSNAEESYDIVQPIITEPGSTMAQNSGSITNPTVSSSVQHNSAHKVISWQYLPAICGIYLLLSSFSL